MEKVVSLEETPVVMKRMQKKTKFTIYIILVSLCVTVLTLAIVFSLKKIRSFTDHTETDCGYVEGNRISVLTDGGKTRTVLRYFNIPYAVPPNADLRWRAPVSLKENNSCWSNTLKFDNRTTMCVQLDANNKMVGNEDCLILNIWKPLDTGRNPMPVVVYFHGGELIKGHSRLPGLHPGAEFAASMEVVVVSVNYRLGVFGFLSLQELWTYNVAKNGASPKEAYGNYGIMDQILALRWVKHNIGHFRGDPNDVTIFGYSGGGTAAFSLLSASLGETKGLFHKLIASSGVSNFHTNASEADQINRRFISDTKCGGKTSHAIGQCLRNLDPKIVLANSTISISTNEKRDYEWEFPRKGNRSNLTPLQILDRVVIQNPLEKLVSKLLSLPVAEKPRLSILLGTMAQESSKMKPPTFTSWDDLKKFVAPRADAFKKGSYDELLKLYKKNSEQKYNSTTITPSLIYSLLTSDVIVTCSTMQLAKDLSQYSNYGVYSYVVSQGLSPISGKRVPATDGVDVAALFGFQNEPYGTPSKEDLQLKTNLRHVFKNFIYSTKDLKSRNSTIEFINSKVNVIATYHTEECNLLRKYGFLKHSWGNLGIWD